LLMAMSRWRALREAHARTRCIGCIKLPEQILANTR
jgi:hypothetical protein